MFVSLDGAVAVGKGQDREDGAGGPGLGDPAQNVGAQFAGSGRELFGDELDDYYDVPYRQLFPDERGRCLWILGVVRGVVSAWAGVATGRRHRRRREWRCLHTADS